MSEETVFTYDRSRTYLQNFQEWMFLNREERELYNQEPLPAEEAEKLFSELYGDFK